jgi:hypothetical protein
MALLFCSRFHVIKSKDEGDPDSPQAQGELEGENQTAGHRGAKANRRYLVELRINVALPPSELCWVPSAMIQAGLSRGIWK